MGKLNITNFFVYRWRYWIGYSLVVIGLIVTLVFVGLYLPGGISNAEMHSVAQSSITNLTNLTNIDIANMPYHILQHISLALFGISILSIKLPSIILAFLSIIGIVMLLRRWFKPRISVLASLIAITTGQFLFIAQNGTADILYVFWPVWLMLIASLIPYQKQFRPLFIIAFCVTAALSLYTPLSIYVLIAFAVAILIHPHLRYIVKKLPRFELITGIAVTFLITAPLIVSIIKTPDIILTLLGIPSSWPNIGANITSLSIQYLGFAKLGGTTTLITPFFELGSMLIILIGLYRLFQTRETAKSYTIALWILCLIPILVLNPTFTSITFLPLLILLAYGLSELLSYWYSLFPRNPYARIIGLVPIVILVTVLVLSGMSRYIYSYKYDPNIVPNFSNDIKLIPKNTTNLVVGNGELAFYDVFAKYNKNVAVSTIPTTDRFLATRAAKQSITGHTIEQIITRSTSNDSDRFYLYKK